jgi:hypothetical protein
VFLDCVLLIIDDYRKYLKYDQTSNEFKFDENIYFQMKNVNNINNELKKNEFYHEFRTTQAFEEFRRDRSDYLKRECEYNNNTNNNANNTIEYPNKDFIESLLDKFKEDQKSTSSRLFNRSKKTFNNVVDKARDKLNRLTLQSSTLSSANQSTSSSINTALSLVPSAFNDFIKDNDSISSESSSSSSSISTSTTLNNNNTSNDEKIKEQIRQYAIESQINLDKPYSRLTIDLTNDPEIKKYFENKVEEKEEEKLIDFSEPTPPTSNNNNNNIGNIKSFDVLNPIRLDDKKTNNNNTYDSIINEFDPILNNEMKVEPLPNYVKLEENKPNYNIHMMPTSLPNSMSFNTGNTYYQQQHQQLQQQQQQLYHFPSASETIARINAINRSTSTPINKSLIKK